MQVIEKLERFCVPLLGSFNRLVLPTAFRCSVKSPFPAAYVQMRLTSCTLYCLRVVSGYPIPIEFLSRITKPVALARFARLHFLEVTDVTGLRQAGAPVFVVIVSNPCPWGPFP